MTAAVELSGRVGVLAAWFCHQRPQRCLTIHGWTLPLCARCTGVCAGILLAATVCLTVLRLRPGRKLAGICLALVATGLVEVLPEQLGWSGGNAVRWVSGLLIGVGVGTLLGAGLRAMFARG